MTDWVDGLGDGDFWGFENPCGLQIVYEYIHLGSQCRVVADSPEVGHVLRHVPFERSDCILIDDETMAVELTRLVDAYPGRRAEIEALHAFQVWRQDDNGNLFAIDCPTSERDAKCRVQHFESLGHKQTYWYTPCPPARA